MGFSARRLRKTNEQIAETEEPAANHYVLGGQRVHTVRGATGPQYGSAVHRRSWQGRFCSSRQASCDTSDFVLAGRDHRMELAKGLERDPSILAHRRKLSALKPRFYR